jgi:CheY-like chemotaxis protein
LLVVEDDLKLAKLIERMLPQWSVTIRERAHDALDVIAAGEPFDVVLCDLHLLGMSGHEFYGHLEPGLRARTVIMTGGPFTPSAQEFLERETGRLRVLRKPFRAAELRDVLDATAAAAEPSGSASR